MAERVKKDKYVSLTYTISDEAGEIVERIDLPINFIQGRDTQVIAKVSAALEGRAPGDRISVILSPAEGFGERQPELIFTDELANVPPQFHSVGAEVEFQNDRGEMKIFRVANIADGKLTVDGNHPLAGKTISYNITVQEVRDATADELTNSIASTPRLH